MVQAYFLTPVWIAMCCLRLLARENLLKQLAQEYWHSPAWILMCDFKWSAWVNLFEQMVQVYGLSPVWIAMWLFRWPVRVNLFEQMVQAYFLSPVWIARMALLETDPPRWMIMWYWTETHPLEERAPETNPSRSLDYVVTAPACFCLLGLCDGVHKQTVLTHHISH